MTNTYRDDSLYGFAGEAAPDDHRAPCGCPSWGYTPELADDGRTYCAACGADVTPEPARPPVGGWPEPDPDAPF